MATNAFTNEATTQCILDEEYVEIKPRSHYGFVRTRHTNLNYAYRHLLNCMVMIGDNYTQMHLRQPDGSLIKYSLSSIAPKGKNRGKICDVPIHTFYTNVIDSNAFKYNCRYASMADFEQSPTRPPSSDN